METDNLILNTPDRIRDYYEEWTDKYIEGFGVYFQAMQAAKPSDIIKGMIQKVPTWRGMKVLDAGCGICGPALTFAKLKNVQIDAVTLSEKQVEYAKAYIKSSGRTRGDIHVQKGDFHELETLFEKESFDLIYFLESLVHSDNPDKAIKSVHKTLKMGGYIYIKDLFKGPEDIKDPEKVNYPVNAINNQFYLKIREVGEIINTLTRNGFRIVTCGVPAFKADFTRGNMFTAKHMYQLLKDQKGPWVDEGLTFLHWLEIVAQKQY